MGGGGIFLISIHLNKLMQRFKLIAALVFFCCSNLISRSKKKFKEYAISKRFSHDFPSDLGLNIFYMNVCI